jgi:putative PEP-CTERM system histidine kinase
VLELSFPGPAAASYGLSALAFLAFSVHLWFGRGRGARASILRATVAISALWAALNLGFALTNSPAFWTSQVIADGLRVGGWLLFAVVLLGGPATAGAESRPQQAAGTAASSSSPTSQGSIFLPAGWWWGAAAVLLLPAAVWFFPPAMPVREVTSAVPRLRLPYGLLLGVSVAGLVLTEQLYRRAREASRWSIKPLCLGLGASFVFDLYMYADALLFGRLDANVWAARGFAQALVIPFIALATVRNKDWTIDIALSRGVVFHSTAFLASGIYLLGVAAAGYYVRYFGGSWGKTFQVGFIFAAVLLLGWLFSSGMLRSKLKVFINKNFFPYRYDYREEWLRFTNLLSTRGTDTSAPQRCIQALANLVESPAGTLWLRNDSDRFTQAARWNLPAIQAEEHAEHSLPRFLRTTGWVINLDEYHKQASRYPGLELPAWLKAVTSAWLIVPVITQDELTGFVILTAPRAAFDVNWEVLDLLKTAARQIGSFLGQIQSSEALLEVKKFDAFNKMAAFVVHDLKNLVAQMSLLLKNSERHRQNPRFQDDMLSTVEHVTERMNKLLLQLSTGSRGAENPRPLELGRLAQRIVEAKANQRHDICIQASGDVTALGYEQRFERVVGHLVQNAIDATPDGGKIGIRVFAKSGCAVIEIADEGCGMSEEFVRERLFRPFQTTKPSGMGIGTYETAQYVKELGGKIETDSRPGAGTRMRIILPLHGENPSLEQQDRELA